MSEGSEEDTILISVDGWQARMFFDTDTSDLVSFRGYSTGNMRTNFTLLI